MGGELEEVSAAVVSCGRCPRLVAWREAAAAAPPARFRGETYWARPVPGFGDPAARLLIVGLAPAANGGNRTGRIFTGDPSGDWLYRALHRAGFANQPVSRAIDDGLELAGSYITAVVHCAPPDNKPLPEERDRCLGYLSAELSALPAVEIILALGGFAWDGVLRAVGERGRGRPVFGHGAVARVGAGRYTLLGSYHPSQRNTSTGLLTEAALDEIFTTTRRLLGSGAR